MTPSPKYIFIACIPIGVDIFIRMFHVAENSFASRLTTGFILGMATIFFVLPGILSMKVRHNPDFIKENIETHIHYMRVIIRKIFFRFVE